MVRIFIAMIALTVADQALKIWVRTSLPLHRSTNLVPNLLDLTHVENQGVSFGFLNNLGDGYRVPLLLFVSGVALVLLGLYWWYHRVGAGWWTHFAFVLILPGAVGNLIDRSLYGAVTDYLHFRFFATSFFVNNLADILITAGVVAFLIGRLREGLPPRG